MVKNFWTLGMEHFFASDWPLRFEVICGFCAQDVLLAFVVIEHLRIGLILFNQVNSVVVNKNTAVYNIFLPQFSRVSNVWPLANQFAKAFSKNIKMSRIA